MLSRIEEALRKNPYIEDVTSYKTPGGKVCVRVKQRLPILHVMSSDGQNYYLDRAGRQMPKSSYYADLVVATGDITPQYARQNLTRLGRLIQDNPFWNHQIQQIHVLENGEVELVPRVGEHTILLGRPTNVEDKLGRMKEFYTEGLNKVGWNKYSQISLKYNNQIICKKIRNDMAVEKEIIVAVEFGSSKIRGVAGCKNIDGSVQVLDIEQVDARHCIRKGVVYNIDKTVMCLKHIVDKMENALDMRVRKVLSE